MSHESGKCHVDPVRKTVDPSFLERSATAFLAVSGMGCPTCAARVRNALVLTEGVLEAEVDHGSGLAVVSYVPGAVEVEAMIRAVDAAAEGTRHTYRAVPVPPAWAAWDA